MSRPEIEPPSQATSAAFHQSATADSVALGIAREKQYIGAAMAVCAMYAIGFLPGLIFNVLWLREANRTAVKTGREPAGTGCLIALLATAMLVGAVALVAIGGFILAGYLTVVQIHKELETMGRDHPQAVRPPLAIDPALFFPLPPPTRVPTPTPAPTPTPQSTPRPSPTPEVPETYITTAPMTVWSALPNMAGATYYDVPLGTRFRVVKTMDLASGRWAQIDLGAADTFVRREVMDSKARIEKSEPLW